MSGPERSKTRRSYRPRVETLESLQLLSTLADPTVGLPSHPALQLGLAPALTGVADSTHDTWDEALVSAQLAELIGASSATQANAADLTTGLSQLDRYLNRSWSRAGLTAQQYDDCTQAVYTALLQTLGRDRFDALVGEIGQVGIRDVLSRETADGPDFFRAIDAVKKRAQRERSFQPLDGVEAATTTRADSTQDDWRSTVQEAISQNLNPREAALIQATLQGESPAEIANHWGIASKTVSNEKTRALQKLRDALTPALTD